VRAMFKRTPNKLGYIKGSIAAVLGGKNTKFLNPTERKRPEEDELLDDRFKMREEKKEKCGGRTHT